ncbi:hypothetical protein TcCL_NonESM04750 [Trypanosoma cruzi]|nr:hypothetical protein TcCL_NonESM04750 [Trypanosoma cruzi]
MRCSTAANRLVTGQASTNREQHASSWTLRFGSNRDGRLSSLSTNPALRRVVKGSGEDDGAHHQGNRPQMWETTSHPLETGAHGVPPRQPRSLSDEGKFVETEVSALTSTQTVLSGRSNHQVGDSTLVEEYRDALTLPRACPHNVLFPFPLCMRPHRLLGHIQDRSDSEWHLVSQRRSIP